MRNIDRVAICLGVTTLTGFILASSSPAFELKEIQKKVTGTEILKVRSKKQWATAYAERAVMQQEQNKTLGFGFTGPEWSSDSADHYKWCLTVEPQLAIERNEKRARGLLSCMRTKPEYGMFPENRVSLMLSVSENEVAQAKTRLEGLIKARSLKDLRERRDRFKNGWIMYAPSPSPTPDAEVGLAFGNLDSDPRPDMVLLGYTAAGGFRYNIGFNVQSTGVPMRWGRSIVGPKLATFPTSSGAGVALANLNDNERPEIVLMLHQTGVFHYVIGWDMRTNGEPTGWSRKTFTVPGDSISSQGAGAVFANLNDNDRPELVLMAYAALKGQNSFRYRIGWDVNPNGEARWGPNVFALPGVGDSGTGAGLTIADLNGNRWPEAIFLACDNTDGARAEFRLRVGFDISADGEVENWSGVIPAGKPFSYYDVLLEGTAAAMPRKGGGIACVNLDDNPRPELICLSQCSAPGIFPAKETADSYFLLRISWNLANLQEVPKTWQSRLRWWFDWKELRKQPEFYDHPELRLPPLPSSETWYAEVLARMEAPLIRQEALLAANGFLQTLESSWYRACSLLDKSENDQALHALQQLPLNVRKWDRGLDTSVGYEKYLVDIQDSYMLYSKYRYLEVFSDLCKKEGAATKAALSMPSEILTRLAEDFNHPERNPDAEIKFFQLAALRAEALRRLERFDEAEAIYAEMMGDRPIVQKLLASASGSGGFPPMPPVWVDDVQVGFVRIQRGENLVDFSDQVYRRAHGSPNKEKELETASQLYEAAMDLFPNSATATRWGHRSAALDKLSDLALSGVAKLPAPATDDKARASQSSKAQASEVHPPGALGPMVAEQPPPGATEAMGGMVKIVDAGTIHAPIMKAIASGAFENPRVSEIVSRAAMQIEKIRAGINYLGYAPNYVPVEEFDELCRRALNSATEADAADAKYRDFTQHGESKEFQALQERHRSSLIPNEIAKINERRNTALDRAKQARMREQSIQHKIREEEEDNWMGAAVASGIACVAGAVAAPFTGSVGLAVGAIGAGASSVGTIAGNIDDDNEIASLQYEERAAAVETVIAKREALIAELEESSLLAQQKHLEENIDFLAQQTFSSQRYHTMAKIMERLHESYLNRAIRFAHLAERALAFERAHTVFASLGLDFSGDLGATILRNRLDEMDTLHFLNPDKHKPMYRRLSLRERYPVEFRRLLQTGSCAFVTSLYDFDKVGPGEYHRRIEKVEVNVLGLEPEEGFHGTLTHNGSFLMRSKQGTMQASRLVPSQGAIQGALAQLNTTSQLRVPVAEGVAAWHMSKGDVLSLHEMQASVTSQKRTRGTFQGFGVAGLWKLELPKKRNNIDYRGIADVKIHIHYGCYYDPALAAHVKKLVSDYEHELAGGEELDRVVAFSLAQNFSDEFRELESGQVSIELINKDFPHENIETDPLSSHSGPDVTASCAIP
jgi:hypothetical protein